MEPLSVAARARWMEIWRSRTAAAWDRESDMTMLTRYILMFDMWLVLESAAYRSPMVWDDAGKARVNPLAVEARQIHTLLVAIEDRFGLQPRARISLGLALSEGLSKLEDLLAPADDGIDEFALPGGADAFEGEFEVSE